MAQTSTNVAQTKVLGIDLNFDMGGAKDMKLMATGNHP